MIKEELHNFRLDVEAETQLATRGGIAKIDIQITTYVEAIKVLISRRNLLAPISRLPQKILAYIFSCLSREHSLSLKWLSITHTCKLWRQTALDTPELWSYINTASRKDIVETFLERSKAADLVIRVAEQVIEIIQGLVFSNYKLVSEHWSRILEHWSRIRDLDVDLPDLADEVWQNMLSAVPCTSQMRRLRLSKVTFKIHPTLSEDLVDCSNIIQLTPSLTSLTLSGFHFSWSLCKLKNLSELVLESMGVDSKRPTIVDILNILALSPSLKLLTLDGVGPLDSPTDSLFHVGLPNLQTFKFFYADADICIKLLETIELPNDVEWNIQCLNYPILEPKTIYSYLPSSLAVCDRLIISLGPCNVQIQTCTYGSSSPRTCLELRWDMHILDSDSLSRILNVLSVNIYNYVGKDLPRLEFHIDDPNIITLKEQWIELLHRFEGLCHLTCHLEYYHLAAETEECLAKALMHTISPGVVICPKLSQLELLSVNFSERRSELKALLVDCLILREENNSPLGALTIQRASGMKVEDAEHFESYVEKLDWDEDTYSE